MSPLDCLRRKAMEGGAFFQKGLRDYLSLSVLYLIRSPTSKSTLLQMRILKKGECYLS